MTGELMNFISLLILFYILQINMIGFLNEKKLYRDIFQGNCGY